ncbi:hydantoinase B/oxoprolinase family protein [Rhodococcus wratislaviensis]|uniref:Hydantoinase B n=1 Tax=Rhodococcus wratislaviensis NBRC 100605 TaxID=1219028 RepID=X0PZ04_RHOWR|nr:hydantoinase B/oxoprolinase family protein [Rhodococcus wratislaviensis]GAF43687.1 hydantoinase B [Rhodococcus wratislaviensis NBRC 100605]
MNAAELAVFSGVVEQLCTEMDVTLERAAFSPIISEATDRACGMYAATDGGVIAQGHRGLPIFVGIMQFSVEAFINEVTDYEDGDVYVLNDPYRGGTHLMDVRIIAPYYYQGELVCFLANTAHWADIGGATPGGFGTWSTSIHAEGLRIPPTRIVKSGQLDRNVLNLILENIRIPQEREGDLLAQLNALAVGRVRLDAVIDRYGLERFRELCGELGDYAERLARAQIRKIPNGQFTAADFLDDDGIGFDPLKINCSLTVQDEKLTFDFAGTSAPCQGPINSPVGASTSAVLIALMHLFPNLLINSGTFRQIEVNIPDETFLSATYPAPVAACASEVPSRVIDTVMEVVGKADPEHAQGGACSTSVNFTLHGTDGGREYIMYFFAGGGYGAFDGGDGLNNACATISMSQVPPIELLEEWYPITFERYEFRGGSGGDGEFRGGLGAQYLIRVNSDTAQASFLGDRGKFPPKGASGGSDGSMTTIRILRNDGSVYIPDHVSKDQDVDLVKGDRIFVAMPGGGGFGDPALRGDDARERDERAGILVHSFDIGG